MNRAGWVALPLALALAAGSASATELFQRGDFRIVLTGSVREIATIGSQTDLDAFAAAASQDVNCLRLVEVQVGDLADCAAFDTIGEKDAWQSLTRLRTRLDVEFSTQLRAVVVYDSELRTGILDTFESELGDAFATDDLVDAQTTVVDKDRVSWSHLLYRGFVHLETDHFDVSVGRQRIAWGVGRLWNPIDRFNAIPPLAIQADQSQGVDSIDGKWSYDGFTFVQAVYAPGSGRDESRYALRVQSVVLDSDISVMGGVFEKAPTVGFDFARNLWDAAARVELVYTRPHRRFRSLQSGSRERPDDFFQVVGSVDYTFDFADGIYVLVEHLYNGNALGFGHGRAGSLLPIVDAGGSTAVFGSSRVVTSAKNQTGFMVGGDITPELRLDLLTIYDWNGESAAFFPSLKYSPLASLEVTVGVQTFAGPRRSQYGTAETFVYLLADIFF